MSSDAESLCTPFLALMPSRKLTSGYCFAHAISPSRRLEGRTPQQRCGAQARQSPKEGAAFICSVGPSKDKYIDEDYIGGRVSFTDYTNKQKLTTTVIGGARWIRSVEDEKLTYGIVMTSQMLVIFDAGKPGPIAKKKVQKGQSLVRFIYNCDCSYINPPLNSTSTTNATAFLILTLTTLLLQTATFGTSTRARLVTIWLRKCRGLLPTRAAHPEVSIQLSGS